MGIRNSATVEMVQNVIKGITPPEQALSANAAVKATQDGEGNVISSTYAKGIYNHNIYIEAGGTYYLSLTIVSTNPAQMNAQDIYNFLSSGGYTSTLGAEYPVCGTYDLEKYDVRWLQINSQNETALELFVGILMDGVINSSNKLTLTDNDLYDTVLKL